MANKRVAQSINLLYKKINALKSLYKGMLIYGSLAEIKLIKIEIKKTLLASLTRHVKING